MTDEKSRTTLSGRPPVIEDGPAPDEIDPETGQNKDYWVLPREELVKGFIRPVRTAYRHDGPPPNKYPLRDLTAEQQELYAGAGYIKYEEYPKDGDHSALGKYWTQGQLDKIGNGCGAVTTMNQTIAETYAREPNFYGTTFCAGCTEQFPVDHFTWDESDERVGS